MVNDSWRKEAADRACFSIIIYVLHQPVLSFFKMTVKNEERTKTQTDTAGR